MSFQARVHHLTTGRFLISCRVEAMDIHEAEDTVISRAALALTANPGDMDVRHLHQCADHSAAFVEGKRPL